MRYYCYAVTTRNVSGKKVKFYSFVDRERFKIFDLPDDEYTRLLLHVPIIDINLHNAKKVSYNGTDYLDNPKFRDGLFRSLQLILTDFFKKVVNQLPKGNTIIQLEFSKTQYGLSKQNNLIYARAPIFCAGETKPKLYVVFLIHTKTLAYSGGLEAHPANLSDEKSRVFWEASSPCKLIYLVNKNKNVNKVIDELLDEVNDIEVDSFLEEVFKE